MHSSFFKLSMGVICAMTLVPAVAAETYTADWESLDKRPVPQWFDDAKFGIFIHWGVYAVPSWSPTDTYSEWYWHAMNNKESETWKFHVKTYGEKFQYQDFAPMFKAELYDPDEWADFFKRSGAKYVVLTSKHHDGFCLWPSAESWNWNSVDIGPHRDLAGDLSAAVKKTGLKMGFYYSLYEWYHPLYLNDVPRYVEEHMMPQFKDLVTRYEPSLIFSDGEWDHPPEVWRSAELLAWLYNESSVQGEVVVDDRWGKETRGRHGGYYTTEYGNVYDAPLDANKRHKWEECRGMGASFGYNRNETIDNYKSATELVHVLIEIVANGGNLLLDIGPTADGRIPVIMQERMVQMGKWLEVNGEAIYETQPGPPGNAGDRVRFTRRDDSLYAICLDWPGEKLVLENLAGADTVQSRLLGHEGNLSNAWANGNLTVDMPSFEPGRLPCEHAWVVEIKGLK